MRNKVNSESATFPNPTVTGTGTEATVEGDKTSEVVEVVGGPGEN